MNTDDYSNTENSVDASHQPRVNLSYVNEAIQTETVVRRSLLYRLTRIFRLGQMHALSGLKALIAAMFVLAYPAMVIAGHKLNDSAVEFGDARHWSAPEIGVASTLIARELDGPGWISDKHEWHPQARLTALPAWQESLLSALSDHGQLLLDLLADERDPDLITAVRLLDASATHKTTDRLLAANETFARYDDRVAGGVTRAPTGEDALIARLITSAQWAEREYSQLAAISTPGDGWLASSDSIEAVYKAKAVAHVTHAMLDAVADREQNMLEKLGVTETMSDALNAWETAARMRPLFIANHGTGSVTGTSHPAIMALHFDQSRLAVLKVAAQIEAARQERIATPSGPASVVVAQGTGKGT